MGKQFTSILFIFLIGLPALVCSIVIPFFSVIEPGLRLTGKQCKTEESTFGGKIVILMISIIFLLPHIVSLFCCLKIIFTLNNAKASRTKLTSSRRIRRTIELRRTLIALILCLMHYFLYGICVFLFIFNAIARNIEAINSEFKAFLFSIFIAMVFTTIIPHTLNLFVYLALIPKYWKALLCKL